MNLGQMQKVVVVVVVVGTVLFMSLTTFSNYFPLRPGCFPFSITHKDLLNDGMLECSLGKQAYYSGLMLE